MIRLKVFISIFIFSLFLIGTSIIKNQTREIEKKIYYLNKKIHNKTKDLNESQLDFSYLSSPSMIEKRIDKYEAEKYIPMEYSKIFLSLSNFIDLDKKFVNQEGQNEKKIEKK